MNIRELFRQALVALGVIPLKFIVQWALIYTCFPVITGAVFVKGFAEAAGLTAILWLMVTLVRIVQVLCVSGGRRIVMSIEPEAGERYQLKLLKQADKRQKEFVAELSRPFSWHVVYDQLKRSFSALVSMVIAVACASLFLTQIFIHKTPLAIFECAALIGASDFILNLGQSWLTRATSIGRMTPESEPGAKLGKMAAFSAALQDGDELVKTAEARFQLEVQTNPGPAAYNERGKHYLSCHQFVSAINDFSQAIAFDDNFAEAYENRADVYVGLKLPLLAGKEFGQACRLFTEQGKQSDLRRAHEKASALIGASAASGAGVKESLTTAAFFFNPKKLDQLKEIELKRINTNLDKNIRTANMYCKKAEILYLQRQYGEALLSCEKAIAANTEDGAAYRIRAEIKTQQLRIDEALKDYDKAIGLNEKDGDAFLGRARLYFIACKDPEAALKDCTHAMSFSQNRRLQLLRGEILITLDRCELAVSDLTEVIDGWERASNLWEAFLLPVFKSIASGLREESIGAYQQRAIAYEKLGQPDSAAQDLARVEHLRKITQIKRPSSKKSGQELH